MRLRLAWAVLLGAALGACRGVHVLPPAGVAAASSRGHVVVSIVPDASTEVGGRPGSVWAVTDGGPTSVWTFVKVGADLRKADPVMVEAVVLHELWHVLTGNVKPHGAKGTVSAGFVGPNHHPTIPTDSDVAGITGRSFDVEPPEDAPPWLVGALERAIATWNRTLDRDALRLVHP